jgi:uncharacterized membrane protein HdeD (DUF308 family)
LITLKHQHDDDNDSNKFPNWLRPLELGLGSIAIILIVVTLTYPSITTATIIRLVSIVLLLIGIERIVIGIALPTPNKSYKLANIGLGPLIIALAIVIIFYTASHLVPPIALGTLALLFNGISKIMQGIIGIIGKEIPKWSKAILIGVGTLNIAVSALAIIVPSSGESILARSISITLLVTGIQMIVSSISIKQSHTKSQPRLR